MEDLGDFLRAIGLRRIDLGLGLFQKSGQSFLPGRLVGNQNGLADGC